MEKKIEDYAYLYPDAEIFVDGQARKIKFDTDFVKIMRKNSQPISAKLILRSLSRWR